MKEQEEIIYRECMLPNGFATLMRENKLDKSKFNVLIDAIKQMTKSERAELRINKLVVACLFELPWEIENTVEHYKNQDENLGKEVSLMADKLRKVINEFLWTGLEEYYENIV